MKQYRFTECYIGLGYVTRISLTLGLMFGLGYSSHENIEG